MSHTTSRRVRLICWKRLAVAGFFGVAAIGCATNPTPDPAGPAASEPTYPILLADEDGSRRGATLAAWVSLVQGQGMADTPAPELQPVTGTIHGLPSALKLALRLPRVGESVPMSEEESREALRRFISDAGPLLCGDPQQLSLIQRADGADGVKLARYQQRPFRYPLRGGYGEMVISFTADGRIADLSSTCIPDTDRIRRGFVRLGQQQLAIEKIIGGLLGSGAVYVDSNGQHHSLSITDKSQLNDRELVIYPVQRAGEPPVIEIHVAWEFTVGDSNGAAIFVDSVTGDILATKQHNRP